MKAMHPIEVPAHYELEGLPSEKKLFSDKRTRSIRDFINGIEAQLGKVLGRRRHAENIDWSARGRRYQQAEETESRKVQMKSRVDEPLAKEFRYIPTYVYTSIQS